MRSSKKMRAWVGGAMLGVFALCTLIGLAQMVSAAGLTLPQGGLGTTTVPQYYILMGGPSTLRVTAVATSSLGLSSTLVGTTGQVAYFSNTNIAQGTSTIFIDTMSEVGIGTTTPNVLLTVNNGTNNTSLLNVGTPLTPARVNIQNNSTQLLQMTNTGAQTTAGGAGIIGYHNAGAAMLSGNRLGFYLLGGAKDAANTLANVVGWVGYAAENWGATNTGSDVAFETTPIGSLTRAERMRITSEGLVGIGTTTPWGRLSASSTSASPTLAIQQLSTGPAAVFLGGNVGIGTTSPGSLLSAQGIANWTTATSTFYSSGGINLTGGGCFAIAGNCLVTGTGALGAGTTGQVAYYDGTNTVSGTSTLFIDTTSRVGIGTTTPQKLLSISSPTATAANIDWTTNTSFGQLNFTENAAAIATIQSLGSNFATANRQNDLEMRATGPVSFWTAATERGRFSAAGNFGLGTTTPDTILSMSGATPFITLDDTTNASPTQGATSSALLFRSDDTSSSLVYQVRAAISALYDNAFGSAYALVFSASNGAGGAIERMRIDSAGNVGIGANAPIFKLQTFEDTATGATSTLLVQNADGGTNSASRIFLGNNTGIGNVTVGGAIAAVRTNAAAGGDSDLLFQNSAATTITTNMVLKATGFLGIGTTTAWGKLSVLGPSGNQNPLFVVASSTANTAFMISSGGHIIASSTSPVLSSCGTGPTMVGSDAHGTVTAGATSGGCTVTFQIPYSATPVCTVTPQTGSVVNTFSYTVSATAIVVTETAFGTGKFDYICRGVSGTQ